MYKIIHNPRCSKSRKALEILQENNINFDVINYLENPLSFEELKKLQGILKLKAIDFTRTGEQDFKDSDLDKDSEDEELLKLMESYPKIIERPIVIKDDKEAIVWRPPENILDLIK